MPHCPKSPNQVIMSCCGGKSNYTHAAHAASPVGRGRDFPKQRTQSGILEAFDMNLISGAEPQQSRSNQRQRGLCRIPPPAGKPRLDTGQSLRRGRQVTSAPLQRSGPRASRHRTQRRLSLLFIRQTRAKLCDLYPGPGMLAP